jgi:hypothetical protein
MANAGTLEGQVVYTMHIPLGPWPIGASDAETRWIREIGDMWRCNALEFMLALIPMLKSRGFEDGMIQKFVENAQKGELAVVSLRSDASRFAEVSCTICFTPVELRELSVRNYSRFAYGYAVRPMN